MRTPLRAQYLHLKQPFPDALLLFHLGDFYELYDHDATIAARELGLTLTTRKFAEGECIPMCPAPYHAVEGPIKRLVAHGYKVAIAAQIGDPRTTKELVEREVVRVVTPASAIEVHRHPPPGCVIGLSDAEPGRSSRPRASRGMAASGPSTSTDGRMASPASAPDGGREERAAAPAVQLALFALPTGDDDRGR